MNGEKRLLLLWANFGPYHLARLEAAHRVGKLLGWQVGGLELAGRQIVYPWAVAATRLPKLTLFPHQSVEEIAPRSYILQTVKTLNRKRPDALAICGYDRPAMIAALIWAKLRRTVTILMSETKADDLPRSAWRERVKGWLYPHFDAALVGGSPHRDYAVSLGLPPDRVFLGYDVVDNHFYRRGAETVRADAGTWRTALGLPRPFFLTVSRFIPKKNLLGLLQAYRLYREIAGPDPWDLVVCGAGPLEPVLRSDAAGLRGVHFPGFLQAPELSRYYGLAGAFILASSHFEQWGLVVNEAMAAGLPVLVSKTCGCSPDLVQERMNGFTFDPYDVKSLARLMGKMSSDAVDLKTMGDASQRIIAQWTPEVFAENLLKAVDAAQKDREEKKLRKFWWQLPCAF